MLGRGMIATALLATSATFVAALAACGGGGSVCGNGQVEQGEQCDDGNAADNDGCSATCQSQLVTVHWSILGTVDPPNRQNCNGVGALDIKLDIAGPTPLTETLACSSSSFPFKALLPGSYVATATLFNNADVAVTNGASNVPFTYSGGNIDVYLDIRMEDFLAPKTGNFFFRTLYGGSDSCTGATPPVTQQLVKLERDGMVLAAMTDNGQPTDGTTPGVCRAADRMIEEFPQVVNGLAWGPATLTITGLDGTGTPQFMESFETFVFAGPSTPDHDVDVNSLAPDAGPTVDAGVPDAGPVDAAPSDAM